MSLRSVSEHGSHTVGTGPKDIGRRTDSASALRIPIDAGQRSELSRSPSDEAQAGG
jgi:hypothetical protein